MGCSAQAHLQEVLHADLECSQGDVLVLHSIEQHRASLGAHTHLARQPLHLLPHS